MLIKEKCFHGRVAIQMGLMICIGCRRDDINAECNSASVISLEDALLDTFS